MGAAPRQDRPRLASRWACGTRPPPTIAPARYKIWMQLGHWKIHHGLGYSSWNIHENNWYTGGILEIFQHPGLGELDCGESILMVKIQIHIHHGLMIWIVRLRESSPNGRMVTAIFSLVNHYDSARQINGLVCWVKSRGNCRKPWNP
jgi:hypothetical protein